MYILSEEQIDALIVEAKTVPSGLAPLGSMAQRNQHKHKSHRFTTIAGNEFVVGIRQSAINVLDFSVILGYQLPHVHTVFRLRRYNGKSHYHTNMLEKERFYDFHIHLATERYQQSGFKEDHFAEATARYYHLESAINCMLSDCGFQSPIEESPLFTRKL